MVIDIITIFPNLFPPYLSESILKRAQAKGLVKFRIHNLRDHTEDKHQKVDDRPYGGGPGMMMRADVILNCLQAIQETGVRRQELGKKKNKLLVTDYRLPVTKTILLDAGGRPFTQSTAKRFSKLDRLILICGHYEGVDARVHKFIDERISVGPYVLTGGELPALTIADAVTRLLPGVLGDDESTRVESHMNKGYKEYPQYTRPAKIELPSYAKATADRRSMNYEVRMKKKVKGQMLNVKCLNVPSVLLNGNHKRIEEWRNSHSRRA